MLPVARPGDRAHRLHQHREQQHTHSGQPIDAVPPLPPCHFAHPLFNQLDAPCGIVHVVPPSQGLPEPQAPFYEYRYTKPENLSPEMKIFSKISQRCLKTTSASAHRNRLSSRSAALLTQKHSHRLRRWLCFLCFFSDPRGNMAGPERRAAAFPCCCACWR